MESQNACIRQYEHDYVQIWTLSTVRLHCFIHLFCDWLINKEAFFFFVLFRCVKLEKSQTDVTSRNALIDHPGTGINQFPVFLAMTNNQQVNLPYVCSFTYSMSSHIFAKVNHREEKMFNNKKQI